MQPTSQAVIEVDKLLSALDLVYNMELGNNLHFFSFCYIINTHLHCLEFMI